MSMSTEPTIPLAEVSPGKLWFGIAAAALCWVGLGIADILITWRECLHQEQFGGASSHPGLLSLNIVFFSLCWQSRLYAGIMSYRNWRRLAGHVRLYRAEATRRANIWR